MEVAHGDVKKRKRITSISIQLKIVAGFHSKKSKGCILSSLILIQKALWINCELKCDDDFIGNLAS